MRSPSSTRSPQSRGALGLVLVAAGRRACEAFEEGPARLAVGVTHHLVGPDLPRLLRRIAERDAGVTLHLRTSGTRDLLERYDAGELDAVVVLRHDESRAGAAAVGAAAVAGLAVAPLARRAAPVGTVEVGEGIGLPPLPGRETVLHSNVTGNRAAAALRRVAGAFRAL